MNQKIYLSEDWLFNENFQEGMTATEYPEVTPQPKNWLGTPHFKAAGAAV